MTHKDTAMPSTPSLLSGSTSTDEDGVVTTGLVRADGSIAYLVYDPQALAPADKAMDTLDLLLAFDARLAAGEPCAARVRLDSRAMEADPDVRPVPLHPRHPRAQEAIEAVLAALRKPLS